MFNDEEVRFIKDSFPTIEFHYNVWGRLVSGTNHDKGVAVEVERLRDGRFACGHKSDGRHFWGFGKSVRVAVWEVLDRMHASV